MLENTIHSIVGLARAEKALCTVTGISLGPFLHIDPVLLLDSRTIAYLTTVLPPGLLLSTALQVYIASGKNQFLTKVYFAVLRF